MIVIVAAIAVLAFFVLALGPLDFALHGAFLAALNIFASLPGESSWFLGSLLYRLLFGVAVGCMIGIPIGLLVAGTKAARVAFLAMLPAVTLTAWLVWPDPWMVFAMLIMTCTAPAAAWWSYGVVRRRSAGS